MSSSAHTIDVKSRIEKATLESAVVLDTWKRIAMNDSELSQQLEQLSLSVLREITNLWISVRGHSFARDWTMNFNSASKKALRKTLKKGV